MSSTKNAEREASHTPGCTKGPWKRDQMRPIKQIRPCVCHQVHDKVGKGVKVLSAFTPFFRQMASSHIVCGKIYSVTKTATARWNHLHPKIITATLFSLRKHWSCRATVQWEWWGRHHQQPTCLKTLWLLAYAFLPKCSFQNTTVTSLQQQIRHIYDCFRKEWK